MDNPPASELRYLMGINEGPCFSFFLPTRKCGVETLQNPIRLKNLLRQAFQTAQARGIHAARVREILTPVSDLVDHYEFWQHQNEGLAVFRSPGVYRICRLFLSVPELMVMGARFHLKPLLPAITGDSHFYVLALSQNQGHLYRASREGIIEIHAEGLPVGAGETPAARGPERSLQSHTVGKRQTAVFHGHGGGEEDKKGTALAFFRSVDQAVDEVLSRDTAPLILACVDYLSAMYREVNSCARLLGECLPGNPERLSPGELLAGTLPVAERHFSRQKREAAARYFELAHAGRACNTPDRVMRAAFEGRVECLFVASGVQVWGRFNPRSGETILGLERTPEDEDVLNLAVLYTCAAGGTAYLVPPDDVPGGASLAALLRY